MSGETGEALRRLCEMRCEPLALRGRCVEGVLMAATESEKMSERMQIAKLLLTLVPARVVTREMLVEGVAGVMAAFDDIRMDAPRAGSDLADVLSVGVVEGTMRNAAMGMVAPTPPQRDFVHAPAVAQAQGYVPVGFLHPAVAALVNKLAGGKLDKVIKLAGSKLPGAEEAPAPAAAVVPPPPVPAPAPAAAAAAGAPPAAAEGDDEGFAGAKKKKKKAVVVASSDE